MNTSYFTTSDGRAIKVEGGDKISVANAISRSSNPLYGPSQDEEEPLPLPSMNFDSKPVKPSRTGLVTAESSKDNTRRRGGGESPLPIPRMNF